MMWNDAWEKPNSLKSKEKFGDTINLRSGEMDSDPDFATGIFCDIR